MNSRERDGKAQDDREQRLRIFIVAGEHSGDHLGAALIGWLDRLAPQRPLYGGVGGPEMERRGFYSLFDIADIAVIGISEVLARLPLIHRRIRETAEAAIAFGPDLVVIIDSPEFTHAVARRIRHHLPKVPVIDYVSPSVWAWRPGRARKMTRYIDHVLALLPFEPDAHKRLGGPPCTYVGHPLLEKLDEMRNAPADELAARLGLDPESPKIVVLPGSRRSEIKRLMAVFGAAIERLEESFPGLEVLLPLAPAVGGLVRSELAGWKTKPHLLEGEQDKFSAFRLAGAALAASGTVTLELALAGCPMVVAYRVGPLELALRPLIKVHSIVLANLVLGENVFPEFLQEQCTPENLAAALASLLAHGPDLERQQEGLDRIAAIMALPDGKAFPGRAAAEIVLDHGSA